MIALSGFSSCSVQSMDVLQTLQVFASLTASCFLLIKISPSSKHVTMRGGRDHVIHSTKNTVRLKIHSITSTYREYKLSSQRPAALMQTMTAIKSECSAKRQTWNYILAGYLPALMKIKSNGTIRKRPPNSH